MTTAGTITAEIAAIKGQMAGVDSDSDAFSSLQVVLNELQKNLLVANAGQGANLGSLSAQVSNVKQVGTSTRHGKGKDLVDKMGWT